MTAGFTSFRKSEQLPCVEIRDSCAASIAHVATEGSGAGNDFSVSMSIKMNEKSEFFHAHL